MFHSIASSPQLSPFGWGFGRMDRAPHGDRSAGTRVGQQLIAAEQTSETDVNLQVQTDQGDTVTLTLNREVDLAAITYSRQNANGKQITVAGASISASQDFQMQVNGSLDDQEMADLQSLVQRLAATLQGSQDGSAPNSSTTVSGTDNGSLGSLSGFELDIERSVSLQVIAMRSGSWQPATNPSSGPATDPAAAPSPPVAVPSGSTDSAPTSVPAPPDSTGVDPTSLPQTTPGLASARSPLPAPIAQMPGVIAQLLAAGAAGSASAPGSSASSASDPVAAWWLQLLNEAQAIVSIMTGASTTPATTGNAA